MSFDNFFEEVKEEFNYEEKKQEFIDNLDMLKSMSVEEQTLYKKWQEFNKNPDFQKYVYKFDLFSQKIWKPTDINNLEQRIMKAGDTVTITPYIIHRMEGIEDSEYLECSSIELWDVIRLKDKYKRENTIEQNYK